uniref:Uncharacterized protein n=1 Tax=Triticum urartu TaxID=4572 RepID=A0A8R7JW07_TRIUA
MGAWKSISKRMPVDVEDVCQEVEIMAPHLNVVTLNGAHDDENVVHHVMELCKGGELLDRILLQGHYTEHVAAALTHTIVEVLQVRRLLVFLACYLLLTSTPVHFLLLLLYALYWFNYDKNC